ncbi:MAG: hypothetical protein H7203_11730 [Rhizobacter sp.]|nr:hypothetical protein [Burkholderiales bacterium]
MDYIHKAPARSRNGVATAAGVTTDVCRPGEHSDDAQQLITNAASITEQLVFDYCS